MWKRNESIPRAGTSIRRNWRFGGKAKTRIPAFLEIVPGLAQGVGLPKSASKNVEILSQER
jgi:hypothetical protein